jgi:cytochrome c oxidase accessory protein FixG
LRKVVFAALIIVYAALPWIPIKGHPALYLDIVHRRFFLFGATFNAQDIWMTVFLLTGAAFGLVFATSLLGRAWCGWACPQTVFLEAIYRTIERFVEGPREKRVRRRAAPWSFEKVSRKVVVHSAWIIVSLLLAHVFLSYFVSLRELFEIVRQRPAEHPEAFSVVMILAGVLYFNFAWFREQFCVVLCPYGRMQSVLLDADSLVVGYDQGRGEPRGKVSDGERGACVDCGRCVAVCPTGIDIRNGLQMDCVACTQCIDACDDIMDRLGQPRGLIRYDSTNGLMGRPKKVLRPRILVYAGLGVLGLVVASFSLRGRTSFDANVLRVQGPPYVLDGESIRNTYRIHLFNKEGDATTFHIEPVASRGVQFFPSTATAVRLGSLDSTYVPFAAVMSRGDYTGEVELHVVVRDDVGTSRTVAAPFLGPNAGGRP